MCLLLARLSAARYFSSAAVNDHEISLLTSVFVRSNTTLILSFLVSGIHGGAAVAEIRGFAAGNLVLERRVVFVLGLHEVTIFWRRSVVAPVLDDTVGGIARDGFGWVEEVILAAGFGNLWWRRLRDEAEALVVGDQGFGLGSEMDLRKSPLAWEGRG
ncbi:hypothetical protein SASPL_104290 [Salvia splendens]|uniref:Uncharacterized protein n=1 Tax=Salvia splendens TaxID=180675 RepID=A0A8X8YGX2_SALSN|nr:hypothetical protein SASPL_104290 [Salvia splendens]